MVVISSIETKELGPYKFGIDGFMVYVGLEFPNLTYFTDPRIVKIQATHEINEFLPSGGQNYTVIPLEYDLCNAYHKQEDISNVDTVDINNFFCIKPSNLTISGYWGAPKTDMIRFAVHKCVNSTLNNNHCYPEEEIRNYVQGGMLSMFVTNSFLNLNDPDKPVIIKLQNWFSSLNIDFTLSYYFKFGEMRFFDDHGFLLNSIQETRYPYFNSPNILYYGKRGSLLGEVTVLGEKYGQRITRAYVKIQDVLMRIGGLLNAFIVISKIIANLCSEFEFFSDSTFNFRYQLGFTDSKNNLNLKEKDSELDNSLRTNVLKNKFNYKNQMKTSHNNYLDNKISSKGDVKNDFNNNFQSINENTKQQLIYNLQNTDNTSNINDLNNIFQDKSLPKSGEKNSTIIKSNNNYKVKLKSNNNEKDTIELTNEIKVTKQIKILNYNKFKIKTNSESKLIDTTLTYLSVCNGLKDFFGQLFGMLLCVCKGNKRILFDKEAYLKKINKLLSINYIFKKFFILEILAKRSFTEEELSLLHEDYLKQLLSEDNKITIYDDSNVFNLEKIV